MKKFPILQSGFISLTEAGLVKSDEVDTDGYSVRPIELGQARDRLGNLFFFNADIDELYNKYVANPTLIRNFDFRESVLVAIIKAFSVTNFNEWLGMQTHSPHYSALHREFLTDTIKFITTGKRHVQTYTWLGLIYAKELSIEDKTKVETEVTINGAINDSNINNTTLNCMYKTITDWTCQPDGFVDMIISCAIIFSQQTMKHVA